VGFVAFATGSLITNNPDLPPLVLASYSILLGACFGAFNGLLVAFARIPSIIVTLGTMALFRSALVEYSDAKSITIAVHFALTRFRPARKLYAVGSNPEAAEMAGINTKLVVLVGFVMAGALGGLAGFMFLARFGTITVVAGLGFELKSVAAAVVGGVNIFGGSGTVIGALIGAILVDLIDTSLVRWRLVSEFWREAVLGGLILLSVTADAILMRRLVSWRVAREKAKPGREREAQS